jgi:CHASE2 domain-containing sensor protein
MTAAGIMYLAIMLIALGLLLFYSKSGKLLKCVLFTAVTGFVAFGVVLFISRFTAIPVAPTPFAVLVSGVLGVPGVAAMLALNLL